MVFNDSLHLFSTCQTGLGIARGGRIAQIKKREQRYRGSRC